MSPMTNKSPFARLRLTGGRFDGPGMPVESLVELGQYRELVLGVARARFLRDNPGRQRMPRGFFDRLQLRLRSVEDGSAMPVLERIAAPGELLAPEDDEFTHARDAVEAAVRAAEKDEDFPQEFPPDAAVLFNRFGQTLKAGEAIELRAGSAPAGARYTTATRRKLVLRAGSTYQDELRDIGWVSEVDAGAMSSKIRLRMGPAGAIVAPLDEVTFEPVKEVLEPNGKGPPVWVSGMGVFDSSGQLLRFDSIHDVEVVNDQEDLQRLDKRLEELEALQAGWLDGGGARPDISALNHARRTLAELLNFDVPQPRVFATPEGGIQAEWTVDNREISVTFESDSKLYAIAVDLVSGESEEPELTEADLAQIADLLQAT
jgi:hypothetical protein